MLLITGASRGIGAATASLAAAAGYAVCVNYRQNRAAADAVVADIEAAGGQAIAVGADVSIEAEVMRLFETVGHKLGRLCGLVNKRRHPGEARAILWLLSTEASFTTGAFIDVAGGR